MMTGWRYDGTSNGFRGSGGDATKEKSGLQSGGNVLHGGSTGGALIQTGVLGHIDVNGDKGGRDIRHVSKKNDGEAIAMEGGRDMVYTGRGGSTVISGN